MIFLPIVQRELRVAARKRGTFWSRLVAALVAIVIGCGFFILTSVGSSFFGAASLGRGLFLVLTWLSLMATLSAGLFFTADCLSEEKRQGTMGFLFLTDLRAYDVVLGKLLSTSLRGSFALLAIFPVLAATLLMGGLTGAQFWQTTVALVNALFVSLAAGIFISTISRDSQKAMLGTLCLLLAVCAGGPALDELLRVSQPLTALSSPIFLFVSATGWKSSDFWPALLINQLLGWFLLMSSCILLPRTWQDKAAMASVRRAGWTARFHDSRRRARAREKLSDRSPVLWLACCEGWRARFFWSIAILFVLIFGAMAFAGSPAVWMAWGSASWLLTLAIYLAIASDAGRFFVESRRNGFLELLLGTPMSVKEIVQGRWRGSLRNVAAPLIVLLAVQLTGGALAQHFWFSQMTGAAATMPAPRPAPTPMPGTTGSGTNTNSVTVVTTNRSVGFVTVSTQTSAAVGDLNFSTTLLSIVLTFATMVTTIGNLAALFWFGMWMGLNSKSTGMATLKTIVFVQIIPAFVITFVATLAAALFLIPNVFRAGSAGPTQMMLWFPMISAAITAALYLAKNIGLIVWARRKLHGQFRKRVLEEIVPTLPQMAAPPVIVRKA